MDHFGCDESEKAAGGVEMGERLAQTEIQPGPSVQGAAGLTLQLHQRFPMFPTSKLVLAVRLESERMVGQSVVLCSPHSRPPAPA